LTDQARPHAAISAVLLILVILFVSACGGLGGEPRIVATAPPVTPLPEDIGHPVTPPDIANGAQIFAANCTSCHGASGAGDGELVTTNQVPPPPDFTDPDTARSVRPDDYFHIITDGKIENLMPPWRSALTESERWDVTLYVYTLAYTQEQLAEGRDLYLANCAECHGETGQGDGARAAELSRPVGNLADQIGFSALQDSAIFTIITEGQGTQMPAFGDELTDEQRQAVTEYVRSLSLANTDAIGTTLAQPEGTAEATAPSEVTITGQVTNGTAGGALPADLPVTLYILEDTPTGIKNESRTTTIDAEGNFSFTNVPADTEKSYVVSATYRDRLFTGDIVTGETLQQNPVLPLSIYELTEDPTVIKITDMNTQVDAIGEGLQVIQEIVFHNNSDRMYTNSMEVGDNRFASVVVGLPPGAAGIAFPGNQSRFVTGGEQNVVVDSIPVVPGEDHIVQLSYFVPYEDGAVIDQPVYYTLEGSVRLSVSPDTLKVTSEQLTAGESQIIQGQTYQVFTGQPALSPGDVVRFELTGRAAEVAGGGGVTSDSIPTVVIVALALVFIITVLVYVYLRQSARTPKPGDKQLLIDGLIRQIAELDNQHDAGKIDEAAYQSQRGRLKARLAELMGEE
jgi:mono/diheme cytochrome c family protein